MSLSVQGVLVFQDLTEYPKSDLDSVEVVTT